MKKCPKCNKEMLFYIDGNFGYEIGVFECKCGYIDRSYSNMCYATDKDWENFWNHTNDIMW